MRSNQPQHDADRMAVQLLRKLWQSAVNSRFEYRTALSITSDDQLRQRLRGLISNREVLIRELRSAILRFHLPVDQPPLRLSSQLRTRVHRGPGDPGGALRREIDHLRQGDLDMYDRVLSESEVLPLSMVEMVRNQKNRICQEQTSLAGTEILNDSWN